MPHPPPPSFPMSRFYLQSQHQVFTTKTGISCHRCMSGVPGGNLVARRRWLLSPCVPAPDVEKWLGMDAPLHLPMGIKVIVGGVIVHPSHDLMRYRGLLVCKACGFRASVLPTGLSKACLRHPTKWGKSNLRAFASGRLPNQLAYWPDIDGRTPRGFLLL